MGAPMAANLARAGFEVHAWNRTAAKAEALAAEHDTVVVAIAGSGRRGGRGGDHDGSRRPRGRSRPPRPGRRRRRVSRERFAIDMSTIGPTAARQIGAKLADRGAAFLDAPVTGSRPKAEDGTLTIMVGGDAAEFERARPLFEAMGELVVHVGALGDGALIKLVNNTLAAVNTAALAEGLLIARKAGVDTDKLLQVVAPDRAVRRSSSSRQSRCWRVISSPSSSSSTCTRTSPLHRGSRCARIELREGRGGGGRDARRPRGTTRGLRGGDR